jgi:hypothetical protein
MSILENPSALGDARVSGARSYIKLTVCLYRETTITVVLTVPWFWY